VSATLAGHAASARLSGRSVRVRARTAGLTAGRYQAKVVARGRHGAVTLRPSVRLRCR
jgi:hypothetical protein